MKDQPITLDTARTLANRVIELLQPYCKLVCIAGSIRRECRMVNDIEIMALPYQVKRESQDLFDKVMISEHDPTFVRKVNEWTKIKGEATGRYTQRELSGGVILDLFMPQAHDWGRQLAIRTGSAFFSRVKLAATWSRKGWVGTPSGLRKKDQCQKHTGRWMEQPHIPDEEIIFPPVFETEKSFWDFLEIDYVPPQDRNWKEQSNK